ncbi:MAG: hypothetical protein GXO62_06780 [Epsilonproteobacteria bacterium]|nr:hypothetical protein [Campylobacterota bacterium]
MRGEVILNPKAQKRLVAKGLLEYIDLSKRVYIAYGSTNEEILKFLGFSFDKPYLAGCFKDNLLNVNPSRPKPVVLDNLKPIDIKDFEITQDDIIIKGANALWYENGKKHAAVAVADKNGGTFGNFYIKAAARGAKVYIPVTHEKLIPFFTPVSVDIDAAMGNKIAMFRFFYGEIFSEIEAFKILFGLNATVIAAGGLGENQGSVVFYLEGEKIIEAIEFIKEINN